MLATDSSVRLKPPGPRRNGRWSDKVGHGSQGGVCIGCLDAVLMGGVEADLTGALFGRCATNIWVDGR
jgi:hypothetical protein